MGVSGLENMTGAELSEELDKGGRFVTYTYVISLLLVSFKRSSKVYFLRHNEGKVTPGLKYSLISFLFGWWGIPWGPIWTIGSFIKNFSGGKNVTSEAMRSINESFVQQILESQVYGGGGGGISPLDVVDTVTQGAEKQYTETCMNCGNPLIFIPQEQSWFCDRCKRYQ